MNALKEDVKNKKIEYGYCHCGCGKKTKISPKTCTSKGWIKGEPRKYLLGHHIGHGENHPRWKGGKVTFDGRNNKYVRVSVYGYHRNKKGRVLEHILKTESAMGKDLPIKSVIHHIDEDGTNNKNNNLVVCQDDNYHKLIHQRLRAFKSCGHADWFKCSFCKQYDSKENLYMFKENRGYHRECANKYKREKRRLENGTK